MCLSALRAALRGIQAEVIVIDNASFDGSGDVVREEWPGARFIQSSANLGFAAANNRAFAESVGPSILFLNPDTEPLGDAIRAMLHILNHRANAGAIGCKLLNSDGSLQTSCIQAFPTLLNQLLDAHALRRRFPGLRLWGTAALHADAPGPIGVDVISGACLMVRRTAFEAVGGFTEEYFMYSEDVDLCLKLRRTGRTNYYLGLVEVVHHGGGSSGSHSRFANVMQRESRARFFRIHRGPFVAYAYRASICIAGVVRLTLLAAALLGTAGVWGRDRIATAITKWVRIVRWSIGLEGWASTPTPFPKG
jgi:GT2 family glycosyltransferase